MPKKPNRAAQLQNYVPAGNGDASGEYADEETGSNIHFTNFKKPDEPKEQEKIPDDDFEWEDLIELDEEEDKKKGFDDDLFFGLEEENSDQEQDKKEEIDGGEEKEQIIDNLDENETKKGILNLKPDLDKDKVNALNDKDANKLLKAINTVDGSQKKYDKLKKGESAIEGIWLTPMTPSQLYDKYGKEGLLKSIQLKKDYFTQQGKEDALQKLNDVEQQINDYIAKREKLDAKVKKAQDLISKYENPNNIYSQQHKDNAVWCKSTAESKKYFPSIETKNITQAEQQALVKYTGTFSFINEPLRGITYANPGSKKGQFLDAVKNMTSAIDKSVIDFDFWTQRGTSAVNFPHMKVNAYTDEATLQSLVGSVFKDQAFVSTGAAKNTGFASHNIILNIYCPKGTKGAYVDNISMFKGENELILQRGYSYKVTKVEKKNGKIYMDCDLLLNSDKEKFNDEQLEEIKNKYFV